MIEIGTEELPLKALKNMATAFSLGLCAGLAKAGLSRGAVKVYATPRRLAVLVVHDLPPRQPDGPLERRGLPLHGGHVVTVTGDAAGRVSVVGRVAVAG